MLDLNSASQVQFIVNKKSIMPVQEASTESHDIFRLINQQTVICLLDFKSKDPHIAHQSEQLVNVELPKVAD